jgi:signal transduction histidine kinase
MRGEVNCIFTKALLPFVEKEVGPDGAAAILMTAGRPREYLIADHNWLPLDLADRLARLAMELMGEPDEERWARRYGEYFMDWKPSREERAYAGAYTMALGSPRAIYRKASLIHHQMNRLADAEVVDFRRRAATIRVTPRPGFAMPRWVCTWMRVSFGRFPTNWGLPRASIIESACAARGDAACVWHLRWKNPPLGVPFWALTTAGTAAAVALPIAAGGSDALPWPAEVLLSALPVACGMSLGYALREHQRRREIQRLLELQGEEVIYSNAELEKKFRDLETKIEQLSLLIDLAAAVNATLDPEKIYEQALQRLVHGMRYQAAYFLVVDRAERVVRGRKMAVPDDLRAKNLPQRLEFPLDAEHSVVGKVALSGLPILINDIETTTEPIHLETAERFGYRALLVTPLRVRNHVVGILAVSSWEVGAFGDSDTELVSAVGNHVALAVERAESFQQLSLLIDLAAAVNATLDPEKIYEQALQRLVHGMRYQVAYFFVVDQAERVVRGHKVAVRGDLRAENLTQRLEFPLDAEHSVVGKVALSGLPILINDIETTTEPIHRATAERFGYHALLMTPLRVRNHVVGVLVVSSSEAGAFDDSDTELISAVANHVALAVERAESFQTIEELSRGLEEKVRLRTEQLGVANEELETAYRDLQATQMQLIQREKMASVGQLVAGVAHELNNPIGFVSSNVTTLEEFVKRLRAMLEVYRAVPLPDSERERVEGQWAALKVDYALKYLDSMILGIREGADRTRKIVRDLRVFARSDDDVWQPVDLHEEIESSLTLLNHLLKDRVTVNRKFGDLPSVECVRSQIDQVFLNLLANAAQAIAGEGEIKVETRRDDGFAVVTITDSGPGIAPENLGRIFDPFFTTKPVGEGTGLGLSISYEILKKHRGEITAASPPGSGATFTVRLPMTRTA